MEPRVTRFLERATAAQLKEKLEQLGQVTTGAKAVLKLRLQQTVRELSSNEIGEYFPRNLLIEENEDYEDATGSQDEEEVICNSDVNDNENLDRELASLRERLSKKQEIMELKKKLSELTEVEDNSHYKSCFNFRDVEESLSQFSGEDNYCITKWLQNFEESAEIFGWDVKMRFIYAKRLMTGTARIFLRTKSLKSWSQLKQTLLEEFSRKVTNADIHNQLRNRKKKREESFQMYVFVMQEIASLGNIEEADVIHYIISGISDSHVNKLLLYNANTLQELKLALRKYEKIKSSQIVSDQVKFIKKDTSRHVIQGHTKCFNCNDRGHTSNQCPKPKRAKGSCFRCGKLGHLANECSSQAQVMTIQNPQSTVAMKDSAFEERYFDFPTNNFEFRIRYSFNETDDWVAFLLTLLDSGSAISFIQQRFVPSYLCTANDSGETNFFGINNSKLQIVGRILSKVTFKKKIVKLNLYIVRDNTMRHPVVLGRDFFSVADLEVNVAKNKVLTEDVQNFNGSTQTSTLEEEFDQQILSINTIDEKVSDTLNINDKLPYDVKEKVIDIVSEAKLNDDKILTNNIVFEMGIKLSKETPFHYAPRRLPYSHRLELQKILDGLLERKIIRESNSPYASPIVLVQKKNRDTRMCIDFRELNKHTIRDNYPLPLIEDLLDRLRGKHYFSILDLRNGFHHVKMADDSIKYTSFVTPLGQFEYLRMPFGLKNAPSVFQRYVNQIFKPLILSDRLFVYMDDLLIASTTIEEHLETLSQVMKLIKDNSLELRYDKCRFLYEEIIYLGYVVSSKGIRPNPENLRAISEFAIPKCVKGVSGFLGLCSYFRKFIQNFATLARPLYDLLKKDVPFDFGRKEMETFEVLKSKLLEAPILAIYSPQSETELHCDASSIGFGAILLQRQGDGKFHPIFYFSKRATDVESRYHSYELETLSIIYALRRFRIYLTGIKFKIVTDCQALTLTLNKKMLNPRISRWALEMQNFDYTIEHRVGNRMQHVDALSRCSEILVVEEGTFESALAAAQFRDSVISELARNLEKKESRMFVLINGLVYRKVKDDVRFYIPKHMEDRVIQTHHDSLCHLGAAKCYDYLRKSYWFPNMREKIKNNISNCLKCIYFSPHSGKTEGSLHNIPKGDTPFDVLHIDHLGPLPPTRTKKKYILLVVDAFSKFTKLYPVSSTQSSEAVCCLEQYFSAYSRPNKIISDRGSAFTSQEFGDFLAKHNVKHIKVATCSPQSNGQVERINRIIVPMFSKESDSDCTGEWYKNISKVEFALNNTICRSIGTTPSMLLFGVEQRGDFCDKIVEHLKDSVSKKIERDIDKIRLQASETIVKNQEYNKEYFDKRHKPPQKYQPGDLVMLKNVVTTAGINKKFLPKYRGPYKVVKTLENDRYVVEDIDNMQLSRIPYKGVCSPANMRPYMNSVKEDTK